MALAGVLALRAHHPAHLLQSLRRRASLMAYTDVAEMAADTDLKQRLYACAATLNLNNGAMLIDRWVWEIVASDPGWASAWAAGAGERRGWDGTVITDDMIWERVRAILDAKGEI